MRSLWRLGAVFCGALCGAAILSVNGQEPAPSAEEGARWERRVQERPGDFIAWTRLGQWRLAQARQSGDLAIHAQAEAAFQAARKEFEDYPGALLGVGWTRLARHRFADAQAMAERVLRHAPTQCGCALAAGRCENGAWENWTPRPR